jgi:hypothetical protein
LVALTSPALSAPTQTFLVDAGGGGDFTNLQAAVDAVPDGSLLRVVPWPNPALGSYGPVQLSGKSLTFLGLGPYPVIVDSCRITDLDPQQTVVVRNFHFRSTNQAQPTLGIANCEGTVRLHGCRLGGPSESLLQGLPRPLLEVTVSADVTLDRCFVGDGEVSARPGVLVDESRLTATHSSLFAGDPRLGFAVNGPRDGVMGGTGVEVRGRSFVWLGDCVIEGGDGESIENAFFGQGLARGGDGGTGLLVAPSASCVLVDTVLRAGAPGDYFLWNGVGPYNTGAPGIELVGAAQFVPGEQRGLDVFQPVLS